MDQSNYVGQTGAGYVVVKGGQVVGTYPTQSAAEQAYNGGGGGGGGASAGGDGQVYQTRNGPRTLQQMTTELQGIGGNPDPSNPDAVFAMYQNVDPNGVGGSATGGNTAVNIAAATLAAQTAYQTAIISGMSDRLAFDKATEAWSETFKQKQFETGQANTVVDQQFRQGQANNTNALNLLGLQSKLSGPANAFEYAKLLTGTPGGLADIVRAAGGAYRLPHFGGGAPGNPTPLTIQTMIDDMNRYAPSGGGQAPVAAAPPGATTPPATTGAPGTYTTVNGVKTVEQMAQELHVAGWGGNYNDPAALAAGYAETTKGAVTPNVATAPTATPPLGTVTTPGAGQTSSGAPPVGMTSAAQGTYQSQVFTGDKGAPSSWSTVTPTAAPGSQTYTQTSGGGYTGSGAQSNPIPGDVASQSQYIPSYGPLQRGNQIAPQNWNIMDPSQQALYLDAQKNAGWLPEDIMASYQRSLKAYGGPVAGAVGF